MPERQKQVMAIAAGEWVHVDKGFTRLRDMYGGAVRLELLQEGTGRVMAVDLDAEGARQLANLLNECAADSVSDYIENREAPRV